MAVRQNYSQGVVPTLMMLDLQKSRDFKRVPVTLLQELLKLEKVFKSPFSMSFYDRSRQWNVYENGLIRYGNHWNFKTDDNALHGKTTEPMPGLNWAKGVYDIEKGAYEIVEVYQDNTIEEFKTFIDKLKQ